MKRIASMLWDRIKTPPRSLIARVFIVSAALALSPALQHYIGAFADDLSNGSWSTTDASNNAAPPNGFPAGMQPNQLEPTNRSVMGGLRRWWERENPNLSTTGSAGAYVLTPTNTAFPTAYTQGEVYCAKANFTSVGNDTLNVNSLGAKAIYMATPLGEAKVGAGTIQSSQQFCASYDAALNSAAGGFQILTTPSNFGASINEYLYVLKTANGSVNSVLNLQDGNPVNGDALLAFSDAGGTTRGSVAWNGTTAVQYNTISDERLKDWNVPQKDYSDVIRSIWVGDFRWKADNTESFGIRAQQLYPLYPEAVSRPRNADDYWQADYGRLAPLALWGVKDLYRENATLKNEITALRSRVAALEASSASREPNTNFTGD